MRVWVLGSVLFLASLSAWASQPPAVDCAVQMLPASPVGDRARFLGDLAQALETQEQQILHVLSPISSARGARYEFEQAVQTLQGAIEVELPYLERTRLLENVAVYGSTNIPLYTLVLHAFIPATIASDIWFRTPAISREVYLRLFELIRAALPDPDRLDGVHLLSDARDVQYETFRKVYVLGLHRNGKRAVRAPSEMVIFTGRPETGRRIFASNARKLQELGAPAGFEQVFLMFGSGTNPLIITQDARFRIVDAVAQLVAFIRNNSCQDCIAPNFSLVHQSMRPQLLGQLLPTLQSLKLAQSQMDPDADYFPLLFSENTDALSAYRERYRRYLATPDARIDAETRSVEPHVFVFPVEMMAQMELEQHYAPFIVLFEYRGADDLAHIAREPRLARSAMFVSIFGESTERETLAAIQAFTHTGHHVFFNQDAMAEENGNLPFGGRGPDASSVLRIWNEEGELHFEEQARPLLFSIEALRWFPSR